MKVVALTVTTKDGLTHKWYMSNYPNLMLSHKYCVTVLSKLDSNDVTGSGWIYEDGSEVSIPHRWSKR